MMGVQIKGLESLNRKLRATPQVVDKAVHEATYEIVQEVQGRAESKLQSSIKHASGELAGSLKNEVVVNSEGKVVGRVWSDNPVSLYREMGTGPVGEASEKDLPEGINPVYTQTPWFFPVEWVDIDLEEIYGMVKVTIQGKEFYKTSGQPARPFLYPALKESEGFAPEILKEHVQKQLREGLK